MRGDCCDCVFFDAIDNQLEEGFCRRYAPKPISISEESEFSSIESRWPKVSYYDYCGEFARGMKDE